VKLNEEVGLLGLRMSNRRKKQDDEYSRLRKEIRELKSVNRALRKRLKKVDREYKEPEADEHEKLLEDHFEEFTKQPSCSHCGKGEIVSISIAGRKFERCNTCTYRSKAIKNG